MKSIHFLAIAGFLILPSSFSAAQAPQEHQRVYDGGASERLISIYIPSLRNAPFTATVRTEWMRPLADGSTITLKNHRLIARDASGRIFQERRMLVGDDSKRDSPITQIEISDPVSHELYICVPNAQVCQVEEFSGRGPRPGAPVGSPRKDAGAPAQSDLGKQFIGGLETSGTQEITVIETGKIGNDRPLLVKREFWYSPQLGLNLISKLEDPRFGTQNFEVTDITLGEPDAKLFQVPSGSKILDLRKPPEVSSPQPASPN
jgi:hypothetical protein